MLISLNWIREYIDIPLDLTMEQLSHDLTMRTVEVEGTENPAAGMENIVAGSIVEVKPHPNADKLRLVITDIGELEPVQIVCGGSNLKVGQSVVVALPGSHVRWHGEGEPVEIKSSKLRGEPSHGMICGASEVGRLEELFPAGEETEILDITSFGAKPGTSIAEVLELDDIVLEIDNKSMTNRPDLWGHYGIARELAAIYQLHLQPLPTFHLPEEVIPYPVVIENPDRCLRYAAAHFRNIRVEPSPWSLQLKLWKVGLRPINNIVDLTNYVMLTTGNPTHGFDKSHVKEQIIVRTARPGEQLELLDRQVLDLTENDLLICDVKDPLALAGIMGGKNDSILPETEEMILEVADFDPRGTRKTTQHHNLRTEASIRYEKGINTQRSDEALGLFQEALHEILPEAELVAFGDKNPVKTEVPVIEVGREFLNVRLGQTLTFEEIEKTLRPLGFETTDNGTTVLVKVPSWRATGDVSLADDILEEVARMIGYENFHFAPPSIKLEGPVNQKRPAMERAVREYLAFRAGFQEIFTYPWVDEAFVRAAGLDLNDMLTLAQPPSPATAHVRNTLIPGLLDAAEKNTRYFEEFRFFEVTQVFDKNRTMSPSGPEEVLPLHSKYLGMVLAGQEPELLFRQAKGILETLPRIVMAEPIGFSGSEEPALVHTTTQASDVKSPSSAVGHTPAAPTWADRKAWLHITSGQDVIGTLGLVSLKTLTEAGIKHVSLVMAEVNLDQLTPFPSRDNSYHHLPHFPLVEQDLSMILDETVTWATIQKLIEPEVKDLKFIEEYRGSQIPQGKKSLTLRLWIGSSEKTLNHEDISTLMTRIITILREKAGAEIRDK